MIVSVDLISRSLMISLIKPVKKQLSSGFESTVFNKSTLEATLNKIAKQGSLKEQVQYRKYH